MVVRPSDRLRSLAVHSFRSDISAMMRAPTGCVSFTFDISVLCFHLQAIRLRIDAPVFLDDVAIEAMDGIEPSPPGWRVVALSLSSGPE
ncbi:hypothetical protein WJ63_30050 [Burkholderia pyrrocinia]|nr:hypothetical protein WJ63_30050 [Burkholderia pyrrocinia]